MKITADKLAALEIKAPAWILAPYLPREGVILLYGKKGVGKSPLTWSLAQAVATGTPWLGHPVQHAGPVLYIEVDSPISVVHERARHAVNAPDLHLYFPEDPLICGPAGYSRLRQETLSISPVLIIFNTLRKIHNWDDKGSEVPQRVYGMFRQRWPSACLLFVHHEKKSPTDPEHHYGEGEEYSGSLAWHNDAQVGLRLSLPPGRPFKDGRRALLLTNTGNQLAAQAMPLKLILGADGYSISLPPERVSD